jgi:hypothetical protein
VDARGVVLLVERSIYIDLHIACLGLGQNVASIPMDLAAQTSWASFPVIDRFPQTAHTLLCIDSMKH